MGSRACLSAVWPGMLNTHTTANCLESRLIGAFSSLGIIAEKQVSALQVVSSRTKIYTYRFSPLFLCQL